LIFQLATASRLLGDDRKQASLRYAPQQIRTGQMTKRRSWDFHSGSAA